MVSTNIKIPFSVSVIVLFGLILVSLHLMSSASQESSELNEMYSWIFLVNLLGSVILLVLVGVNVISLFEQLKKREAGSRLTARMVFLFVLLTLAPATIVFYFSMQFLHRSIDSWFNVEIDRAMDDSLELSQASMDQYMRWHLKQTRKLALDLQKKRFDLPIAIELDAIRETADAKEMTLLSRQGRIIASSSVNPGEIVPHLPNDQVKLKLLSGKDYVGLDQMGQEKMMVQTIVNVDLSKAKYLLALYPVPLRLIDLADSVEFAFYRYQEMAFLRNSLKFSFSLTLSLVLLLSLLGSIWVAFISIRHIVAPVRELVKGTQAVAAGNYEQQLPVMNRDELGFLVSSFNEMTLGIAKARDYARLSSLEVEDQRSYLETILANLTSGVISFDSSYRIQTANQTADAILNEPVSRNAGQSLATLMVNRPGLADWAKVLQEHLEQYEQAWQINVAIFGSAGRQELLCRGTPLLSSEGERTGSVMVFDDVTDLMQAQKNAAWGEVARRLAHEIKNPLTPIQLAAERLQQKLAGQLDPNSVDILERSTKTIVHQVEAMKKMVDEFSDYARPVRKEMEQVDLKKLIQEVLGLYGSPPTVRFETSFVEPLPDIKADPVRIRQLLHNLIKNSLEAIEKHGLITISVKRSSKNIADCIEIMISDNGPGVDPKYVDNVFDPYVTTKTNGTGLGLAIVKKIVEEHGGKICLDSSFKHGTHFLIQFPVSKQII